MRNLNPDHLLAFVTVVEKASFTAAARTLNLSQPAVSQQVRDLEARCGAMLVDRSGRTPKLTEAGSQMIGHARRILADQEEALTALRRLKTANSNRLRVGMSTTVMIHLAAPALRRFRAGNPKVALEVVLDTSPHLVELVRENDLDLAIVTLPQDERGLKVTPCLEEEIVAIVPKSFGDLPEIAVPSYLSELDLIAERRDSMLKSEIEQWFSAADVEPRYVMQLEHLEAIRGAVSAGLGAAVVPRVLLKGRDNDDFSILGLKPRLARRLAVIVRSDRPKPDPAAALRKLILEEAAAAA
jgi:DNA-binding transcriptional LysR family regulator